MLQEGGGGSRHGYRNTQINSQEPRSSRPTCTCPGTYRRPLTSIEMLPLHGGPVNHHQKLQVVALTGPSGVREQGRRPHRLMQGPLSGGGSEPSPPRPTGTSGSCPPTASLDLGRVKPPDPAVWPMAPISDTPWRPWVGASSLPSGAPYLPQAVWLRPPRKARREALPRSEVERQGALSETGSHQRR